MHVVRAAAAQHDRAAAVKPTAFFSKDGRSLVVHVLNLADEESAIVLDVKGLAHPKPAARHQTSATQDIAELKPLEPTGSGYLDVLPARSLTTYRLELKPRNSNGF